MASIKAAWQVAAIQSIEVAIAQYRMCADDIWLWAHAWEEPGCLGSPTTASNYWRICGKIACHHRIDGYVCRREDLPLGRELSFDVVRSVPNSPQHGPTVRPRSSRAPAKLAIIVNNSTARVSSAMVRPPRSTLLPPGEAARIFAFIP